MSSQPASKMLLQCLVVEDPQAKAIRLSQFSLQEWESLLEEARRHGLTPLLAGKLNTLPPPLALPESIRQRLHQASVLCASRNLLLYHELGLVLTALHQAGVPVIALKGAFLAEHVYENIAMRPMGDVDLLVRRDHLAYAAEILSSAGYHPSRSYLIEKEIIGMHHLPPYTKPGALTIESHWTLAAPSDPLEIDMEAVWSQARTTTLAGAPAQALSSEDLLIHLGIHFCQHEFRLGLKHLYDLAQVLAHGTAGPDWNLLYQRAARFRATRCLFLVLSLALELLRAPVPQSLLEALRPPDFEDEIYLLARERILAFSRDWEIHPDIAALWRDRTWRSRLATFRRALFVHPTYLSVQYNLPPGSRIVYLYYPVRLLDLLKSYGGQLTRMLRGDPSARANARRENALADWLMTNNT